MTRESPSSPRSLLMLPAHWLLDPLPLAGRIALVVAALAVPLGLQIAGDWQDRGEAEARTTALLRGLDRAERLVDLQSALRAQRDQTLRTAAAVTGARAEAV